MQHEDQVFADFDRVYKDQYRRMRGLAYALVGQHDPLDDLLHDAYTALLRRMQNGGVECAEAYLHTTVVNRCVQFRKRKAIERDRAVEYAGRRNPSELSEHARFEDTSTMRSELWSALDSLGTDQRTAIVLRHLEDRTFSDIAHIMSTEDRQIAEATVRSWVHRAHRQLETKLSSCVA